MMIPIFFKRRTNKTRKVIILINRKAKRAPFNPCPRKTSPITRSAPPKVFKRAKKAYLLNSWKVCKQVKRTIVWHSNKMTRARILTISLKRLNRTRQLWSILKGAFHMATLTQVAMIGGFDFGELLAKIADEIKAIGIKSVTVSIDSHKAYAHDKFRQLDGLHENALKAIKLLVERKIRVV